MSKNVLPNYIPNIQLIGDWDAAANFLKVLPMAVASGELAGRKAFAHKLVKAIRRNIRNGYVSGVTWPEYSEKYSKFKSKHGGNTSRKWLFNKTYMNALTVLHNRNGVFAGVPPHARGTVHKGRRNRTLAKIAHTLEYGNMNRNIQARPLWRPTFKQIGGNHRALTTVNWHIRKHIAIATGLKVKL